jgi:hypothetical protein
VRLRRGELVDLYVEGGRSVVMVGENVLVLSEIATQIVISVPEGGATSLDEVTTSVVGVFGEPEPPDTAAGLTLQQVHDLAAHGVLVVEDEGFRGSLRSHLNPRPEERAAAVDALRWALRHLRSDDSRSWPLPTIVTGAAFAAAAHQHHVVSYLAAHLDRLDLPPQAAAELKVSAGRQHAGAGMLAADLARALDVLDATGIRALAFKGVALATLAHGDFAARGAGDLDLLVAPDDLEVAHAALAEAGWAPSPEYPAPGPSWAWRHLVRTGNELPLTAPSSMIDLHWHLVPTRGTFPDFDTLWSRRVVVDVDGQAVPTLAAYDALAHSAGHAAKDRWQWLRSLLDVHLLASRTDTWESADRPLRGDQLVSLGLAARILGPPPATPPPVVHEALDAASDVWESVLTEQASAEVVHRVLPIPGMNFLKNARGVRRSGGAPREVVRLLSRSALPPWLTAAEDSPHGMVAAPRVLARRTRELAEKLRH